MSKFELKSEAFRMRRSGMSILDISRNLSISKSTVSLWCRDIVLNEVQKRNLIEQMRMRGMAGRIKGAEANKRRKLESKILSKKWADELTGNLTNRDKLMAGIALYWAEGSKADTTSGFIFVNSDPKMIKFMHDWLIFQIRIDRRDIRAKVAINEIHKYRIEEVLKFWSHLLDLPLDQFSNTFFSKSVQKKVYENRDSYFGVMRLSVKKSTMLKYKVLSLIEAFKANVAQVVRADVS